MYTAHLATFAASTIRNEAPCVQAGDKVLLPEYGGHQVKLGEEELFLYREEDILGKLELK